jgi:hypothetical protein
VDDFVVPDERREISTALGCSITTSRATQKRHRVVTPIVDAKLIRDVVRMHSFRDRNGPQHHHYCLTTAQRICDERSSCARPPRAVRGDVIAIVDFVAVRAVEVSTTNRDVELQNTSPVRSSTRQLPRPEVDNPRRTGQMVRTALLRRGLYIREDIGDVAIHE